MRTIVAFGFTVEYILYDTIRIFSKSFLPRHKLAHQSHFFASMKKNQKELQEIFAKLPKGAFDFEKASTTIQLSEVMQDKSSPFYNRSKLYMAHFNTIPNFVEEEKIDCKKANAWLLENYADQITNVYFNKRLFNEKKLELDDVFYFLFEDLVISIDTNLSMVYLLFRKTDMAKVEEILFGIKKFRKRKYLKPEISLLTNSFNRIDIKSMNITKPKLDIEYNYNDDFKEVHKIILERLSKKNDKGLVLLHGKPGTGKTSYIRYLISTLRKNVIFLPPNMASAITNPDLISVLIDNPNSIFVIEDAENIIMDREKNENSPVSALLNISDGLLSDCLNIQIICSFNTDLSKVDSALTRKGRLIAKYEFKELEVHKAQKLSEKLGFKSVITTPKSLTDIYNQDEMQFQLLRNVNPIGFQRQNSNMVAQN